LVITIRRFQRRPTWIRETAAF